LSQIGKKYERKTLLETILDPSKAISHEYVPYLLETESGQVHAGFLVEKTDSQVVLRDIKNQVIRVPAGEVVTLEAQKKSLMPELVLRDVTAQDAADLLAYLSSLTSNTQHVGRFKVLGPFISRDGKGIETDFGPEANLKKLDATASYKGAQGRKLQWTEVAAEAASGGAAAGLVAIDQVKYCRSLGLPTDQVTMYYAVYADSSADQDATLLLGSDDACVVWVNGRQQHLFRGSRAIAFAQDKLATRLRTGRNTIIVKVENYSGPGGVALSISAPATLQLQTQ
jgi:putative heme-binding domain-containing protein